MTRFAIILSARDGAAFLEAQLESLRAQSAGDWRLYVRDDGSSDATPAMLREWTEREARIEVLASDGRNLGAAASFGVLLQHALDRGERYVFPCDQDDVWMPDRCERMLAVMREREARVGEQVPLLVHSDLRVVDERLGEIHPSFAAQHGFESGRDRVAARLLLANRVTGCAALLNAALLRCALPMPAVAMHDWWLAQCGAAFGEVVYIDQPTVLYRQHGANVVGARGMPSRVSLLLRSPRQWWLASAARFLQGLHQVWTLRARARARGLALAPPVQSAIDALWEGLGTGRGAIARIGAAMRSGALPAAFSLRCLALARIALLPALRRRFGDEREGEPGEVPRGRSEVMP